MYSTLFLTFVLVVIGVFGQDPSIPQGFPQPQLVPGQEGPNGPENAGGQGNPFLMAPTGPSQPIPIQPQQQPPGDPVKQSSYDMASSAEANKIMDKVDEDRITAEIEDLQHKLGDLQANIDRVLRQETLKRRRKRSIDTFGRPKDSDLEDSFVADEEDLKAAHSHEVVDKMPMLNPEKVLEDVVLDDKAHSHELEDSNLESLSN